MSIGAVPGTGPATGPLSVVRKAHRKTFADLPTDRTLVMGILNVTDNSFSDGGENFNTAKAIDHGLRMHYAGADIIDVGGESTAPGTQEVSADEEQRRIIPVVEALIKAGVYVSVDTRHTDTARAALELGEVMINDVSGLNYEPDMPKLIAETGARYIVMHNRGNSKTMDGLAQYEDLVGEVVAETQQIINAFLAAGVTKEQLIVDPGLGFSKAGDQNWQLLNNLDEFQGLGYPVLIGASRKRFIGSMLATNADKPVEPRQRDHATAAITTQVAEAGVWGVRVHSVIPNLDAVKTVATRQAAG
ncbi:dihydropteroate synthase [Enteractinococcus helveticum]|uniref:Dihydropteroate synthase n=1 Tax=Enteractinococcus helveticum TaxID=1837282 RepID=A0A1B7LYW9_9MICC|nr:dihydropteroate synthase [Enteractinococcus helveticum]OAV60606.1 dihydropteroate synthase [Enteractinococcus helveticum]